MNFEYDEPIQTIQVFTGCNSLEKRLFFLFFSCIYNATIFLAFNNLFAAEISKSAADTANMKGYPRADKPVVCLS